MNTEPFDIDSPDTSLEFDGGQLRVLVEKALAQLTRHLDSLAAQPAGDTAGREPLARSIDEPLPETGAPVDSLLARFFDELVACSFNTASGGYLAFIPGGGLPHSAVADLISGITNRYVGYWPAAPALVQIEATVVRWFCEIVGYGAEAGGFLTSGGSLANFSALFTARRRLLGDDLSRGRLYTSGQAHASVGKAAMLAGFAPASVQVIESDERQRVCVERIESQIESDRAAGKQPFAIVAHAGTTNTGAIDDLTALADLAARQKLWLHVDAAYGGFFLLTERGRELMSGIERADSITLDPHKGLFLPYGTGCLLVREQQELRRAHALGPASDDIVGRKPDYLTSGIDYFNFVDEPPFVDFQQVSPELSRPFRGLRVWLPLKMHGIGPVRKNLDEKLDLARYAADALRGMPAIEMVAEPELSLLAFRLKPPGCDDENELRQLNEQFLRLINARQRVMLSATTVSGRLALRICVLNFRTHRPQIEACLADIREAVEQLLP